MKTQPPSNDMHSDFQDAMAVLRTLRDELRVDLHLAGMDVKDQLEKLEQRFRTLEGLGRQVTRESVQKLEDLSAAFNAFRTSLAHAKTRARTGSPKS